MNFKFLSASAIILSYLFATSIWAAPEGDLIIHNSSENKVTAQVSTFGKFNIEANAQKNVAYRSLELACSPNPTQCTAQFYINDKPAGSAVINASTGKLIAMNLQMKVHTTQNQRVLRSVVIH
jgi:hypothetical protein